MLMYIWREIPGVRLFRRATSRGIKSWKLPSGATLDLRLREYKKVNLKVTSAWVDTLAIDDNEQDLVSVESSDRLTFKVIPRNSSEKTLNLSLSIPENVNIRLTAQDLNVCFKNKIMGNLFLSCNSGSILIDKYRGENITMNAPTADIVVSNVLEGNVTITAGSVSAKRLHCNVAAMKSESTIDIKAVYAKKIELVSLKESINVDLLQGYAELRAKKNISVSKLIGCANMQSDSADIDIYIDELSTSSKSRFIAYEGKVQLTVNPKVEAGLGCRVHAGDIWQMGERETNSLNLSNLIHFEGTVTGTIADGTLVPLRSALQGTGNTFSSGKVNVKNFTRGEDHAIATRYFEQLEKLDHENLVLKNNPKIEGAESLSSEPPASNDASGRNKTAQLKDKHPTTMPYIGVCGSSIVISSRSSFDELRLKYGLLVPKK